MAPRIVYVSWPAREITGGIKMTFRHVEALREGGLEAVVASVDGLAPHWFRTAAPAIPLTAVAPDSDVLVFPENHHELLERFARWPNRKVVFCQNQYMAWRGLGGKTSYADFGVSDVLCCSPAAADFCRRRFPDLKVGVAPNYIDPSLFKPGGVQRLQVAYMPRKRPFEAQVVRDLFRAENPQFRDVPWVEIARRPEAEVAKLLRESAVFLSLARFESFCLSALEALASGCVVAGFTGFGARDYATAQNGFWAEEDDCPGCADQLARAARLARAGGPPLEQMVGQGVATAAAYSRERFKDVLLSYWREFLGQERRHAN